MRLLNSSTIELEEPRNNPNYAILSHTWGENEISCQDLQNLSEDKKNSDGYKKIKSCCEKALSDGLGYVWIDTCCIDKTSSADLSEAINSMFLWYRNARVCYAYLADVPSGEEYQPKESKFRKSRWFTRGWTLQELLAPLSLVFFDQNWVEIGTKSSLQEVVSEVTGISSQVLLINHEGDISVAQRMFWASKRQTTRVEDEAYCLIGIFGVNMPMLYGEGEKAFIRLQLEILKLSDDHTIFAWTGNDGNEIERGLLARSPKEFANCGNVCQFGSETGKSPYSMTNKGLHIELPLIPHSGDLFLAVLNCQRREEERRESSPLGIYLKRVQERGQEGQVGQGGQFVNYVRVLPTEIVQVRENFSLIKKSELYIKEKDPSRFDVSQWMRPQDQYLFSVIYSISPELRFFLSKLSPKHMWKAREEGLRLTVPWSGAFGALVFQNESEEKFMVILAARNYNVWCDVVTGLGNENVGDIQCARGGWPWQSRDRITKSLPGGRSVFVSMKRGTASGGKQYLIQISIN